MNGHFFGISERDYWAARDYLTIRFITDYSATQFRKSECVSTRSGYDSGLRHIHSIYEAMRSLLVILPTFSSQSSHHDSEAHITEPWSRLGDAADRIRSANASPALDL
jgi:hypothetical protein